MECIIIFIITFLIFIALMNINNKIQKCTGDIIIPIKGHKEDIEFILRKAIFKIKWREGNKNFNIICRDCGMDYETRKICEIMQNKYKFIYIQENAE